MDKKKEAEKQREREAKLENERKEATRQAITKQFNQVKTLIEEGRHHEAWTIIRAVEPVDVDQRVTKKQLEAMLWGKDGLPEKQLEVLEGVQADLPFDESSLEFYYDLACLLQRQDSPGKALHIFKRFIDNQYHTFRNDILERYRQLKDSGVVGDAGSGMVGETHRVYVGGMQPTVESLRAWIDQSSRLPEYFRHSILLNDSEYDRAERVDRPFNGDLSQAELAAAFKQALARAGLDAFQVEEQRLMLQFGGPQGQQKPANILMLCPRSGTPLNANSGAIRFGVEVALIGRTGASLNYYEFFTPARPEDAPGQQPDIRDFNDAIYQTIISIHATPDPQRNALIGTLRDLVKGTVEAELERRRQSGYQSFF
ncbi:MAG: hypothetical protein JAZ15_03060 [Candidatus Thiodiazotropha endolucinida]|nr:hypothetical protein [Candidatus Thiodiazotropha taylori]MCW4311974.1 hypothetical protein [Candidatus Thiodiazotropha taylori]